MACRDLYAESEERNDLATKVHNLTHLLCVACQELDAMNQMNLVDDDLREWWKEHLKQDAQRRREAEAKRKLEVAEAKKDLAKAKRKLNSLKR